jgi:hypothetical protein
MNIVAYFEYVPKKSVCHVFCSFTAKNAPSLRFGEWLRGQRNRHCPFLGLSEKKAGGDVVFLPTLTHRTERIFGFVRAKCQATADTQTPHCNGLSHFLQFHGKKCAIP